MRDLRIMEVRKMEFVYKWQCLIVLKSGRRKVKGSQGE